MMTLSNHLVLHLLPLIILTSPCIAQSFSGGNAKPRKSREVIRPSEIQGYDTMPDGYYCIIKTISEIGLMGSRKFEVVSISYRVVPADECKAQVKELEDTNQFIDDAEKSQDKGELISRLKIVMAHRRLKKSAAVKLAVERAATTPVRYQTEVWVNNISSWSPTLRGDEMSQREDAMNKMAKSMAISATKLGNPTDWKSLVTLIRSSINVRIIVR